MISTLPYEERRPQLFSTIFGRIHAPVKLPELLDVARAWEPDAIVFDSCDLAAPIAAAALGLPSVNHSFGAMIRSPRSRRRASTSTRSGETRGWSPTHMRVRSAASSSTSLRRALPGSGRAEAAAAIARGIEQMGDVASVAAAVEQHAAPR